MIPSSIINTLVLVVGCLVACYLGSTLPGYEWFGAYLLGMAALCAFCLIIDDFPLLLAVSAWIPFSLPVPIFSSFPTFALVLGWILIITFFRVCLAKSVRYVRSYNVLFAFTFCWVPIRFLLSPVHKLGSGVAGGSGVSGLAPYFSYVVAFLCLLFLGVVLTSREKLIAFLRWQVLVCFVVGISLLVCAFIPATGPYLVAMGSFSAGDLGDGIQRLVVLPGYGLFLVEACLCRTLVGLTKAQATIICVLGLGMIIVGGNRSAVAGAAVAMPIILFLNRQTNAFVLLLCSGVAGIILLHVWIDQRSDADIPPLVRSLGIFDSKIDDASGGTASAQWRYDVWMSAINKILENPLTGKGFGNLPDSVDPSQNHITTDYEAILAGGEAHNGFVNASYGFGIPFMLALTIGVLLRTGRHAVLALRTDAHDVQLREYHALLAGVLASYPVLIYSAFDLSALGLWLLVGVGIALERVTVTRRAETSGLKAIAAIGAITKSRRSAVPDLS